MARRRPARRRRAATRPAILAAAADGSLGALLVGGVDLDDLPDPDGARAAVDAAPFVVSLELRHSAVTDRADVVFPVAPVTEKAGTFVNWEGRLRPFDAALPPTGHAPTCGCSPRWPTRSASTSACATPQRSARNSPGSARGRAPDAAAPDVAPAEPSRRRRRDRPSWPGGECCWTRVGFRTASRISPARRGPPSCGCREATAAEIGAADGDPVTVGTRARRDHAAAGDHRHARPRRVAAAELAGFGASLRRCGAVDRRRRGPSRRGGDPTVRYPDLTLVRPRPVVAGHRQGSWHLRLPAAHRAGRDPGRAQGARLDADALGPNRVGPFGLLQSLADGIKLALKEGLIPAGRRQADLSAGAGHLGHPRDHGLRRHPDGRHGQRVRPPDSAAAHRSCRSPCSTCWR